LVAQPDGTDYLVVLSPSEGGTIRFSLDADAAALDILQAHCRYFAKGKIDPISGVHFLESVRYRLFSPTETSIRFNGEMVPTRVDGANGRASVGRVKLFFEPLKA